MNEFELHQGDAIQVLREADPGCVQCCVTSPPYWGLRDYGVEGQLGLEERPEQYVERLVEVFREVRRVLTDDGTLWLNLGDSYANDSKWGGASGGKHRTALHGQTGVGRGKKITGLKEKDLVGIPWMVAFALRADGWYLRSDIIWAKGNPMPESVTDRPTRSHEYLFLFSKSPAYYFDVEAIMEASVVGWRGSTFTKGKTAASQVGTQSEDSRKNSSAAAAAGKADGGRRNAGFQDRWDESGGTEMRRKRDVWTVSSQPYRGAHFAVMPEKLVEPCVLAGSRPGDTVLDPFCGSGTVGVVALAHGRKFAGIDLNPEYLKLARERIDGEKV